METTIKFSRTDPAKFFRTLNKRVNSYFKDNDIKRTGNWKLIDMPGWIQLLLTMIMGAGMAGVGMNVMHDGNHGSFSSKKWVNKLMGSSIYILAGNVYNWQVQQVAFYAFQNM